MRAGTGEFTCGHSTRMQDCLFRFPTRFNWPMLSWFLSASVSFGQLTIKRNPFLCRSLSHIMVYYVGNTGPISSRDNIYFVVWGARQARTLRLQRSLEMGYISVVSALTIRVVIVTCVVHQMTMPRVQRTQDGLEHTWNIWWKDPLADSLWSIWRPWMAVKW
jgi:hypothetical protein